MIIVFVACFIRLRGYSEGTLISDHFFFFLPPFIRSEISYRLCLAKAEKAAWRTDITFMPPSQYAVCGKQ